MRRPLRPLAVVVTAGLAFALAGCTETPSVVRSTEAPTSTQTSVAAEQTSEPNPDLTAAKKAAGIGECPTTDAAPAQGGLPDVAMECLGGGREVRLAELRGPTVVNVWASWCGPCREEAPFLGEAGRRSSAVSLIGVNLSDSPAAAVAFAGDAGWTYPQLYDADQVFRTRLQVSGLPVTFFVRADGTVAGRHAGPFTSSAQLADLSRQHLGVAP